MTHLTNLTMRPSSTNSFRLRSLRKLRGAIYAAFLIGCLLCGANSTASGQSVDAPVDLDPPLSLNPAIVVDPSLEALSLEAPSSEDKKDASHLQPTPTVTPTKVQTSKSDQRLQQIETENRAEAIRNRIDLLKEIMARKKADAEAAQRAAHAAIRPSKVDTGVATTPTITSPPETPAAEPATNSSPNATPASNNNSESIPGQEPVSDSASVAGQPILSTPVNSFELANSLFATGNYAEAIKSYEALLKNENITEDTDWIKCLAANCYRILGEISMAENLYREVAASKNKSYPSDHSIWFLDHLSRRKGIEAQLRAIDGELQSLLPAGN